MSTEALEQMITEAPAMAPEGEGAFAGAEPAQILDAPPLPQPMKELVAQGVCAASRLACAAAHVTPLDGMEVAVLSEAVAGVLGFYVTPDMDPKTAAWLGLGIAAVSVVVNRKPLEPVSAPVSMVNDTASPNTVTAPDGTALAA